MLAVFFQLNALLERSRYPSLLLSPHSSVSLLLRSSRSNTVGDTLRVSRAHNPTPPIRPSRLSRPYLRPWPSCVHADRLSSSIASVYTRALPLFVTSKHGHRARAREMRREAGGGDGREEARRYGRARGREKGKMREEEEKRERGLRLAWRTMGFSCILLIFPKVRGGSLTVCSARA